LLRLSAILIETLQDMRQALSRRTLLEMALIRCVRAATTVSLEEILAQINELKAAAPAGPVEGSHQPAPPAQEAAPTPPRPATAAAAPAATAAAGPAVPAPVRPASTPDGIAERNRLVGAWAEITARTVRVVPTLRPALADTKPLRVQGDRVVIGVDREFVSHAKDLVVPRNRKALEHVIGEVLKRTIVVEVEETDLGTVAPPAEPEAVAPPADAAEAPAAAGRTVRTRQQWQDDPAVKKAQATFKGKIVDIRD
jgi:hypothetical protein